MHDTYNRRWVVTDREFGLADSYPKVKFELNYPKERSPPVVTNMNEWKTPDQSLLVQLKSDVDIRMNIQEAIQTALGINEPPKRESIEELEESLLGDS
ncbi:hypothetical protein FRC02_009260 [Tulasnella sp. 418]|nr:hypothetical protein FRC02_009260 [Tulasnella sp. 418]